MKKNKLEYQKITITVPNWIWSDFKKICESYGVNYSKRIAKIMLDDIRREGEYQALYKPESAKRK